MLKMVDGTGIIGVDMVCPLGGAVSPPQPPNYDKVEVEGVGSLMLPNSLKAPLERVELLGNSVQGENPAPDNPQEIKSAGKWNEEKQKYEIDVKVTNSEQGWTEEQTLTLTSDRPITKWDKLVEQGGQYGWLYGGKIIDSYNSEPIDTEYMSSTGQLSIGATVLYRLKEPELISLSQEEQTQLRNLHSYNGTTHITVDSGEVPCGIKLTYRKEK